MHLGIYVDYWVSHLGHTDPLRTTLFNPVLGIGRVSEIRKFFRQNNLSLMGCEVPQAMRNEEALVFPVEQYPGLILGFLLIYVNQTYILRICHRREERVRVFLRITKSPVCEHFPDIGAALPSAIDAALLQTPATISADPVYCGYPGTNTLCLGRPSDCS